MSPKQVDANAKKQLIAAAALRAFSQKGFQQTRVQDIAHEAGIGKGTIYEYFRNKEEIVHEIFEQKFQQMITREAVEPRQSPLEALLHNIRESLYLSDQHRELNRLWFDVLSSKVIDADHPINKKMQALFSELGKVYGSWIVEGQELGEIRTDINAESNAGAIVSALDGIALHSILFPIDEAEKEHRYEDFVRMVKTYLSRSEQE